MILGTILTQSDLVQHYVDVFNRNEPEAKGKFEDVEKAADKASEDLFNEVPELAERIMASAMILTLNISLITYCRPYTCGYLVELTSDKAVVLVHDTVWVGTPAEYLLTWQVN